jgi:phosphatidylglycerol lysyltransferase
MLLASRWTFGLRIVIPAACGAVGMRPAVFTIVDFVAVLIWALTLGLAGYYSGAAIEKHLKDIQHVGVWVLLAVVLCVAAVVGARRVQRQARVRELNVNDLHGIVPFIIGLLGAFNIFTALGPRRAAAIVTLARWMPLDVPEGNRLVMLFAGLALLQVTRNLARRKELAWWVATPALAVSVASQVGPHFELQRVIVAVLLLVYLVVFRRRFSAQSDPATLRRVLVIAPVLAFAIVAYGYQGLRALDAHFTWPPGSQPAGMDHVRKEVRLREAVRGGILISGLEVRPRDKPAARFLASLQVAGWMARLYLLVLLLRPVVLRDRLEAPPEDVDRIRRAHGHRPLSAFALQPDKHHLLVADGRGLVAYAVRNAVAVACGGPLCAPRGPGGGRARLRRARPQTRVEPVLLRGAGGRPPRLRVIAAQGPAYRRPGDARSARGRKGPGADGVPAEGRTLEVWRYNRAAAVDTVLDEQIVEVSDEWLAEREIGELHFTFGSLDLEELGSLPVFVCGEPGGRIEAFCTWLPYANGTGLILNLLRRRREAPEGVRERLLARTLEQLAPDVREVSLGLVPSTATAESRPDAGPFALAERLGALYRYDDLYPVKDALGPRWEPQHLVYPGTRTCRASRWRSWTHTPPCTSDRRSRG